MKQLIRYVLIKAFFFFSRNIEKYPMYSNVFPGTVKFKEINQLGNLPLSCLKFGSTKILDFIFY